MVPSMTAVQKLGSAALRWCSRRGTKAAARGGETCLRDFASVGKSRMQLGVTLFPDFSHERLLELARLAEAGGFAYLGIADSQSLARDVYVALTALARETRRIRI